MKPKAFTLIELLVVIAIIAILAAILFPVFAQAKASAKAIASISNIKQISLATIMYSNDADDELVRVGNWNSNDPDAFTAADGWASWTLQVDPYQKSVNLNGSPLAGPIIEGSEIARRSGTRFMTYGYNYSYLSPSLYSGGWPTPVTTISATSPAEPADTVLLTDRVARQSYGDQIYWYGPGVGWMIMGTSETPACYTDPNIWCTDGWGTGSWYQTYITNAADGQLTGGVSPRDNGMVGVALLDGHVKKLSLGALSVGTNWNPNIADSSIVITDPTKYLWNTSKS